MADLYQHKFDSFGTTQEERFRLFAGDRQIAEITRKDGADQTLYFHPDHLGSPETISDDNGAAYHEHFDPFGAAIDAPSPELTRVGFTGQDHDRDLGLIDMKGRIYDPLARRFMTADPVTQAPFWSQGLNRYSYVFNNPINNVDPSGFEATDSGLGITGWGAGVAGIAALQGFSVSAGAILGGVGIGALNPVTTLLTGIGNGSAASTHSAAAPSAAPKGSGSGPNAPPGASNDNKGGTTELAPPDTTVPEVFRGDEGKVACHPACSTDPDAAFGPNKAAANAYKKSYMIVAQVILAADALIGVGRWLTGRGAAEAAGAAQKVLVDANRLNHIFGKAGHNLAPLVEKLGSQEATFTAVQNATQAVVKSRGLSGIFETTVEVAGHNVVVRGNVIDGAARIGTFFIR